MKQITIAPKSSVPRLNSLFHRLQQNPGPDEEQPYLDQLMMFLDHPPACVTDRWKDGAAMCAAWGITTSSPSVYRLYHAHIIEWRARLAQQAGLGAETPEALAASIAQTTALRIREILSDPDADPAVIASLARLELQQQALELARQKHSDHERDETTRALDALDRLAFRDRYADFILREFKAAIERKPSYPSLFPIPPSLKDLLKSETAGIAKHTPLTPSAPPAPPA